MFNLKYKRIQKMDDELFEVMVNQLEKMNDNERMEALERLSLEMSSIDFDM